MVNTDVTEGIVALAEQLLSERFGGTQELHDTEDLGGSDQAMVLRARLSPSPFLQLRSVVIKYVPLTGDPIQDAALVREVAAYQFTTALKEENRPGPQILAYDLEERIMVITDVGSGETFSELLLDPDPDRRMPLLRNLGKAIGLMHAGTATREQDFTILVNRMLRQHPEYREVNDLRENALARSIVVGRELLEDAGVAVPAEVAELADDAASRLLKGPHRAFTPFDLSPDNIIVADRTQFLDYEWAGFRDIAFDLASVISGFPQYLSARPVTDEETDAFLGAWARETEGIWPTARDRTLLLTRIAGALLGWAFLSISLMTYGSLSNALVVRGSMPGGLHVPEAIDLTSAEDSEQPVMSELLAPASEREHSDDERLVRRDLFETFEALARIAARGGDERLAEVARFAADVSTRLDDDGSPQ